MQSECPRCLERRDRLFSSADDFAKFKVGQLDMGRCDRCLYREPLDDTAEFTLESAESASDSRIVA